MNLDRTLNIILAIAIVGMVATNIINAAKIEPQQTGPSVVAPTVDKGEIVYDNILTRSSVRSYTSQEIPKELLEKLVRAGLAAPTAMNKQPWKIVVSSDRKILDALAEQLPYGKMLKEATAAIAVVGDLNKTVPGLFEQYWIQDTSAVTENILLAAHGFGLGAVWLGVYPDPKKIAEVSRILKLDKNLIPLNVISIGYPKGAPKIKNKWKSENVIWLAE